MTSNCYLAPIETDSDGELVLILPENLLDEVEWYAGDKLIWKQLDNGAWSLRKHEDSDSE